MGLGRGKLKEEVVSKILQKSIMVNSATVFYNQSPVTDSTGTGIDTQGYDNASVFFNVGTLQGPLITVGLNLLESDTDNPLAASLVQGCSLTLNVNGLNSQYEGSVTCKDRKRYLFLKQDYQGATAFTAYFGANVILGKPDRQPQSGKVLHFDV